MSGILARPRPHLWVPPRTVVLAAGISLVLHLLWLEFIANTGGDLAAQDAWTSFAIAHPNSAYDFAWYGGMHPASYSLIAPYLMGVAGVRGTLLITGTVSAALVALLLTRVHSVRNPTVAAIYAAVALTGNAVSGRATFGLGVTFALGAVCLIFVWRERPVSRAEGIACGTAAAVLAALATACSPVAGLFLGLLAAALWLRGRRWSSLAVGVAPVVVVVGTAVVFPFFGIQPLGWYAAITPFLLGLAATALLPRDWKLGRAAAMVYSAAVVVCWLVPSPIGSNVTRLALLFGGTILVAVASGPWRTSQVARRWGPKVGMTALAVAIFVATGWQVVIAGRDATLAASAAELDPHVQALVSQLDARGADLGRVEVVPSRSHREASALAPYVNLARGWNRQADVTRNPMFYRDQDTTHFTRTQYHRWLRRWGVRMVVLPRSPLDYAATLEGRIVRRGVPYLQKVWSDPQWSLYEVVDPAPMVSAPASFVGSDADGLEVRMPEAGSTVLRVAWSPWLTLVDADGKRIPEDQLAGSCLDQVPTTRGRSVAWVRLTVSEPGLYRVAAPYGVSRGTPCTTPGADSD